MVERIAERRLVWSGEHWIAYLRRPGEEFDSGSVSLYHTRYSPGGEGNVAFIDIPGEDDLPAVFTDNREVAAFVIERMVRGRGNVFDRELPVIEGEIRRGGDIRRSPSWTVTSELGETVATWTGLQAPLVLEGPGPIFDGRAVTHSLLFFTDGATVAHNGRPAGGEAYARDIWRRAIGRPGSSCVFALAETVTAVGTELAG